MVWSHDDRLNGTKELSKHFLPKNQLFKHSARQPRRDTEMAKSGVQKPMKVNHSKLILFSKKIIVLLYALTMNYWLKQKNTNI